MTGKELSKLRKSRNVSQSLLAEMTGWRQYHISRLESYPAVRPLAVSRYLAGLEKASLRVSEEDAALEARNRETIARLLPATTVPAVRPPTFDPEVPHRPSPVPAVPTGSPS